MISVNASVKYTKILSGTKAYFEKSGFSKAVLGMSGGLDSSVCAHIAKDVLGEGNVFALLMPEKGLTADENIKDAIELAKNLGINYSIQEINTHVDEFKKLPWKQTDWSIGNLKPRVRMMMLYNYANANSALVLGTSNKSELLLGYGTKHGDLGSDIMPIGNIYKTELIEIASYLELPEKIIKKEPTAELMPCQTDADDLGAPYNEIDPILKDFCDEKKEMSYLNDKYDTQLVKMILERVESNKHKGKFVHIVKC